MKIISYISSLFGENKCFGCQKSGHFFCPQCNKNLEIYSPYCYVCKKSSSNFYVHKDCNSHFPIEQVIVLTRYRNAGIKKLLRHAKYYNKYRAYEDIIFQNAGFFRSFVNQKDAILVPVPMHFLRKWKRGYNQSDKIAQNLSKTCKIPVKRDFIKKIKYSSQQSHLSRKKRTKNLRGVFSISRKNIVDKNSTIYLVDDIISTGSTVLEIANLLHQNGYKKVRVVCLASD